MKKYLTVILFTLISSAAYADGSPCGDVGQMIGNLEHQKKTTRMSTSTKDALNSRLSAGYQTYYQSGCTESELQKYFKNGEKPKSKGEILK